MIEQPVYLQGQVAASRVHGERIDLNTISDLEISPSPAVVWARRHKPTPELEEYRIIRTKVAQHPQNPRLLLVSSADVGDGKSVNAVNLAGMLAVRGGSNVLLLDGDMRKPTVPKLLGIDGEPGLADILNGSRTLAECCHRVQSNPTLYVVPAGNADLDAADLLQTEHWFSVISSMRATFDYIVIDSPPVGAVADYELLEIVSDGVIFVVRQGHTDRMLCFEAMSHIPTDKLLGVIMNGAKDFLMWKSTRYYPYPKTSSLARKL
jgi:capsular exopolysaccharide synthesis family protein